MLVARPRGCFGLWESSKCQENKKLTRCLAACARVGMKHKLRPGGISPRRHCGEIVCGETGALLKPYASF